MKEGKEQDIDLFGFAEVDMETTDEELFKKFGPIFASGYVEGEKQSLTGVKNVRKCVMSTPLLQWYGKRLTIK